MNVRSELKGVIATAFATARHADPHDVASRLAFGEGRAQWAGAFWEKPQNRAQRTLLTLVLKRRERRSDFWRPLRSCRL